MSISLFLWLYHGLILLKVLWLDTLKGIKSYMLIKTLNLLFKIIALNPHNPLRLLLTLTHMVGKILR